MESISDEILSITTILVALTVALIAYQQHRLARDRFKLDLFERRFHVYSATKAFMQAALGEPEEILNAHFNLARDIEEAQFIFSDEVYAYLKRARKNGLDLRKVINRLAVLKKNQWQRSEEDVSELTEKEQELIEWFGTELQNLGERFAPDMKFRKWA